jgi:serine protease
VTLAAPGGDQKYGTAGGILSTVNPGGGYNSSGFDFYQGTSMASPHVAGVAGLIYAISGKTLKPQQVEQILYTTTHDFGQSKDPNKSCVGKKPCGHGILDAEQAVLTALTGYDIVFSAPKVTPLSDKSCAKESFLPGKTTINSNGILWVQKSTGCESEEHYKNPHIQQRKDGTIYASYGSVSYDLDQSTYKECHVIGYDGVGCFL